MQNLIGVANHLMVQAVSFEGYYITMLPYDEFQKT